MFPAVNHLPELSTPIAEMIIGDHGVSQEPSNPCQCVPENRRSDMPDVHRLRDIRRAEVNDDRFAAVRPFHAKTRIREPIHGDAARETPEKI